MRTFLAIMVGRRPNQARPILATSDKAVVQAAMKALMARVGVDDPTGEKDPRPESGGEVERRC